MQSDIVSISNLQTHKHFNIFVGFGDSCKTPESKRNNWKKINIGLTECEITLILTL